MVRRVEGEMVWRVDGEGGGELDVGIEKEERLIFVFGIFLLGVRIGQDHFVL